MKPTISIVFYFPPVQMYSFSKVSPKSKQSSNFSLSHNVNTITTIDGQLHSDTQMASSKKDTTVIISLNDFFNGYNMAWG